MIRFVTTTALAAALALTTACSGEQTADDQTATSGAETPAANTAATDPNNPYAQAEQQMGERMMAAVGQNAAETWVRKMIEHHRGAIAMTEILEMQGGDPQVLEKGRETANKQRQELQELERMLQAGVTGNTPANPYEQSEHEGHQRMMAAVGENPSETWLRKMIEHHRAGVEMSDIVIRQGGNSEVTQMARRSADEQRRDIAALERLLGGEAPAGGPPAAAAEPAEPSGASQLARTAASATPRPTASAAPAASPPQAEASADPHAGHTMSNTSD